MRTPQEILDRIQEVGPSDFMGIIRNDLVDFLEFKHARQFLKETAIEKEWSEHYKKPTVENVKCAMRNYLDFAFKKAEDERGISAARSMDHYSAWIWLLGEEERFGNLQDYDRYGMPHLNNIKDFLIEEVK